MSRNAPIETIDAGPVLIVGAGLAGLFAALRLKVKPVTVLASAPLGAGASSIWAQGGIAAAIGEDDSAELHIADTIAAGAGLVDPAIARILAEEAPRRINDLRALGVPFDHDATGKLVLGREAAHSRNRIARVKGDQAGLAVMTALIDAVRARGDIKVIEGYAATDLVMVDGRVAGVVAMSRDNRRLRVKAANVVLALGGAGALYEVTTNPPQARGTGLGFAARAGAIIGDAEFVQFHPTALAIGKDPAPLATEALRGEGAHLVDETGSRIMRGVHPDLELAPRDVVARAIHRAIAAGRKVFLDVRKAVGAAMAERFPSVTAACRAAGIDPVTDLIPVAPAAHYHMGGIATDARGRTSLPGLWACGEVANTGAHGANRLASNSLLEAIVFAARIASDVDEVADVESSLSRHVPPLILGEAAPAASMAQLRRAMTRDVGVERNGEGLARAMGEISGLLARHANDPVFANAATAALMIATGAWARRESRGGHFRSDWPKAETQLAQRQFRTLAEVRAIAAEVSQPPAKRAAP
ncbi:MAG TPA: L-aspartate oxidase [Micropepsaceae bacterium]|nr:L-aspartate oxidase [Micropepsaceae bacterium]